MKCPRGKKFDRKTKKCVVKTWDYQVKKLKPIKGLGEKRITYGVYMEDRFGNVGIVKEFNSKRDANTFKKLIQKDVKK